MTTSDQCRRHARRVAAVFFFGGLVQIIVTVMEISRGNLFGAAMFGTYGPF